MDVIDINKCVKLGACVCARDGLISEAEEELLFKIASNTHPEYTRELFDSDINEFFDSEDQIEDYLTDIQDPKIRKFAVAMAEKSASIDGLDIRENIALRKVYLIWGINP